MLLKRIRIKEDTAADPTWAASNLDPLYHDATVGGTTTDGVYSLTVVPSDGSDSIELATFTRGAAETDAAIATALIADAQTNLTAVASYISEVITGGSGVVRCKSVAKGTILDPDVNRYTITVAAPSPGTITLSPDDNFPIRVPQINRKGKFVIEFVAVDVSGDPIAPASGTVTAQLINVNDRRFPYGRAAGAVSADPLITSLATTTTNALGDPWVLDYIPPGDFAVQIDAVASLPGGTVAVEVWASVPS